MKIIETSIPENTIIFFYYFFHFSFFIISINNSNRYNAPEITNSEFQKHYFAEDADVFSTASALFVMMLKSIPFNSSLFSDPYYSRLCKKDTSQFWKIFDPACTLSLDFKGILSSFSRFSHVKRPY